MFALVTPCFLTHANKIAGKVPRFLSPTPGRKMTFQDAVNAIGGRAQEQCLNNFSGITSAWFRPVGIVSRTCDRNLLADFWHDLTQVEDSAMRDAILKC